jgi:hypothetical protein
MVKVDRFSKNVNNLGYILCRAVYARILEVTTINGNDSLVGCDTKSKRFEVTSRRLYLPESL